MRSSIVILFSLFALMAGSARAQTAKSASATINAKAIQLLPSSPSNVTGVGVVTAFYSTFNGSGAFLIDSRGNYVSGEVRPRAGSASLFEGAYLLATPVATIEYGTFAAAFPTTDSDGDGTIDVIQFDKAGSFSAAGSGVSTLDRVTFSMSIQFTRSANSSSGTYAATTVNVLGGTSTVNGAFSILGFSGNVNYTRGSTNSMVFNLTSRTSGEVFNGTTSFASANSDSLSYPAFTIRGTSGAIYSVRAGTFARSSGNYRGTVSLVDGGLLTSWADFLDYAISITDTNDSNGDGVPDLTDPTAGPPVITTQPISRTVSSGATTSFSVVATGATSYQWFKDERAISGATQPTLTLTSVQLSDSGTYRVFASNIAGTSTSNSVTLSIPSAPIITTQPFSLAVLSGIPATLSVVATGTAPLTYSWRRNGLLVASGSTPSIVISIAIPSVYTVTVSNSIGSVTSVAAAISVVPASQASSVTGVAIRTTLEAQQILTVGVSVVGGLRGILFRAAGPSLGALGVSGTMPDPKISLFDPSGNMTALNDNWGASSDGGDAVAAVGANVGGFPFASRNSLDAAILATISGGRTIQVSGTSPGNVIVEAYDGGYGSGGRLANVSALNRVGTGGDVLIAGFTISGGTTAKNLLIRAVGPSLTPLGVTGVLADPQFTLNTAQGIKIAENDNYASSLSATFASVGAFPLAAGSKDAAIVTSLPPGGYTVVVSGADGGTGTAIVEVYELP